MNAEVFAVVFPLWIRAFIFTLCVEVPIFVLLGRLFEATRTCPLWRLALSGAAGTCLTHPLLWFVWPLVVADYTMYIVSGELLVAVIESVTFFLIARPIPLRRAVLVSFAANAVSYGSGAWLN